MSAGASLVVELEARGHRFEIRDGNQIAIKPAPASDVIEQLSPFKGEILEELHRRQKAVDEEWRVDGCQAFTIVAGVDEALVGKRGVCLACGGTWIMHGRPRRSIWRRVRNDDEVQLAAVRLVLASAIAIAIGAKA